MLKLLQVDDRLGSDVVLALVECVMSEMLSNNKGFVDKFVSWSLRVSGMV